MIEKVLDIITEHSMLSRGDKVIVAVSGGPDSMCLLHILDKIKEKFQLKLFAAHINHCLRGEEADKDEEYTKEMCISLGIPFYCKRIDIKKLSKERKLSTESAAREARYDFFQELLTELGAQKIALAHNANDQAETVLMRIIRGTGMEGLVGIKPIRENIFIRPIINITRREIENYCEINNLKPRIDATNLESIYTRNKIRLELLPYIEDNFNPDIIGTLNRLSYIISKDNEYIEVISQEKYKKYCDRKYEKVIIYKEAFTEHESIITRIIRMAVFNLKGNLYNLERIHIYDIIKLQKIGTGKRCILPGNIIALNNYGNVEILIGNTEEDLSDKNEYVIPIGLEVNLEPINLKVTSRLVTKVDRTSNKNNSLIKYFDYEKLNGKVTLRFRKNGDKFIPFGMKGSKKLKDLFMDLKIPKEERDTVPLICFNEQIAWIVGYRVSDAFKIDDNTSKILEIKIERGV